MSFDAMRKWVLGSSPTQNRELFDAMSAGVWIVDSQDRTEYVNTHMAGLLGHTPVEMSGLAILSFIPPEAQPRTREYLERCRRGAEGPVDVTFHRRDGSLLTTIVSASPLAADSETRGALGCFLVDITERRQVEDALRRTEAHYRALAETAQDHIFVIDRDDRVEFVNQAAAQQLRTSPDRLIGKRRTEIFPPDVAERQGKNLRQVVTTGKPLFAEGRTLYLDREVWLGTWLAPVFNASGEVTAVLGLSRDMTARKRAEDELRATEQRLRVVLSNVPVILWASDREGVSTFCAGQALQALGVSADDVVGRSFKDLEVEPFAGLGEHVRRALAGESFSSHIDVQELTFEAWTVPLRDETHAVAGATGVIMDITERRRLEIELSNAQKMEAIGRLAGGIAHDFNNNLTAILGYVDMILGQIGDDKPISKDLKEVQHAAERAAGLVRRLLAFGRRQVIQPRELDLNSVIEGLKPMLERLIGERTQIVVALAHDLRPVTGDAGQLEQVIMNLALNARDAMPAGGTLTIETANVSEKAQLPAMATGQHVLMTIRDTGMGMDASTKEHLFEPFFTTKPVGEGTGLGLSTVYGIVKQLGGFIWVDSEPGQGAAFRIFVPAAEHVPEILQTRAKPGPAVIRRETILLVEDEETVRRFAKLALERHGFHVIEAATPEQALSLAASTDEPIPLLLTDVVMPRLSGPELADRLRTIRPGLAVLYMSGYPASMVMQGAPLDAAVRLLPKPFTTADLLANIEEILRTN